jgi:hypothetical protein
VAAQIDQFYNDLRVNMTMIEEKLRSLKGKTLEKADEAEPMIRQQIDFLQKKIDERKAAVEAARAKVKEWGEAQKGATQKKIAEWKAKVDAKSLQARADMADDYAIAMAVLASSAVDEAAKAALDALHAHYDVAGSKVKQSVR